MLAADLTCQQRAVPDTIRLQHPAQRHNIMSVPWLATGYTMHMHHTRTLQHPLVRGKPGTGAALFGRRTAARLDISAAAGSR